MNSWKFWVAALLFPVGVAIALLCSLLYAVYILCRFGYFVIRSIIG